MRFAVIGSNFITEQFLEAAKLCKGFTLAAYYSRSLERARECAQRHGAPLWFDSIEQLAQCGEVDAVYIASPNSLHCEQSLALLRAKKHVLCEKPIASNAAELHKMLAAARENGVLLLEAMRPAFAPGLEVIRQSLPKLGAVRRATFRYCQYSSRYDKFKAGVVENAFNPAYSNGALVDIGIYCVYPLIALFGVPDRIMAAGVGLADSIDGVGSILAQYQTMVAELIYSKITNSDAPSEIQGENGCLYLNRVSVPQEAKLVYRGGGEEALAIEQNPHDMLYELEAFLRLAAAPEQAEPHQRRSLETLALLDEARAQMGIVFPADLR